MTFFSFIHSYRKTIGLTLFYIFIANLLSLALPWGVKVVIDDIIFQKNTFLLNRIAFILLIVILLRSIFGFLRQITSNKLGEQIVCDLREKIYWQIYKLSLLDIKKITPSQILTRITGDVESVRRFIFGDLIDCMYSLLSMVLITTVLCWINPRLTGVALLTLPFFIITYFRFIPKLKKSYHSLRKNVAELSTRINEVLQGMSVVKAFTAEDYEKRKFSEKQKEILKQANKAHFLNVGLWGGIEFFTSLGTVGVLWIGGGDVIAQRMTAGELIAFYSYLGMLFSPIVRLVTVSGSYQESCAALNRINELFEVKEEIIESKSPIILSHLQGFVEFRNVSFSYESNKNILNDISFSVEKGEVVGIVGSSGVGKTTLIHLLLRFFDPQQGSIYIDGKLLKDFDLESYRKQLSVVLQDDYLFSGTVRENIDYGCFESLDQKIEEVSKITQAYPFIQNLKEKYSSQIGERGMYLSSGQRQRLAMARALMRNPSILILDEATSALDAMTENQVQQEISRYCRGKTVFIVAHRFSTIMEADKIIVLDQGRIAEMGGHKQLMEKEGFYSRLYKEQFKEEVLEERFKS